MIDKEHLAKVIRNLILIAASSATGVYVLWKLHSVWGVLGIALALGVALPTEFNSALKTLRGNAAEIKPVIDEVKGHGD